jgi:hypothetical protein
MLPLKRFVYGRRVAGSLEGLGTETLYRISDVTQVVGYTFHLLRFEYQLITYYRRWTFSTASLVGVIFNNTFSLSLYVKELGCRNLLT